MWDDGDRLADETWEAVPEQRKYEYCMAVRAKVAGVRTPCKLSWFKVWPKLF